MLRIHKDGKRKLVSIGLSIHPQLWDFTKNEPKPKCPNKDLINKIILDKKAEYQKEILELNAEQKDYTASSLVENKKAKYEPKTVIDFYKELIRLRKSPEYKECFTYGGFTPVFTECDDIFAYLRTLEESHLQILVAANYGTKAQTLHLPSKMQEMLLSNMACESELSDVLRLDSCQVVVVRLNGND